jgi:hypothetical protein
MSYKGNQKNEIVAPIAKEVTISFFPTLRDVDIQIS